MFDEVRRSRSLPVLSFLMGIPSGSLVDFGDLPVEYDRASATSPNHLSLRMMSSLVVQIPVDNAL